ncbi:nucleotidyltransferase family protein [Octadecabacter sp. 1_MG-2023]|uniref:nucleotidyltransferase family protein n=1 Tax=unclassified Octadecabacter TaxID=196158 RepID=UPI001C08734C|nr:MULTISPECIES: nucleotidyltransferase family protein [unclassified Octadecabacter]MBU2993243.1 nucleotidyltransferase family protein [Octadecabacter sp. B2R22]MDO6733302.1 nucleotidyltransferase family protein [Octadecabacter sp. 1_MG-2023]
MIATLLLAAGASSRMGGRDKLLEDVGGAPLLQVMADRALSVGPTYVTVPSLSHKRNAILPAAVQVIVVDGQMSDSIKAGIASLPVATTGVLILPADMPDITANDLALIGSAARQSDAPILRAMTEDGRPGHPTYFAASQFDDLSTITGDRGASGLLAGRTADIEFVALQGDRARLDLDTPQDWDAYRARS